FDCSGMVEESAGMLSGGCGSTAAMCSPTYSPFPTTDCGTSVSVASCAPGGPGGPTACYTAGSGTTLGCK
ncbi:MAG TPA: hypothetical protein VKZ18_01455, partial [Polyangia bacterium]|nr:hypothetical protein [Polyangia bacterium]